MVLYKQGHGHHLQQLDIDCACLFTNFISNATCVNRDASCLGTYLGHQHSCQTTADQHTT